MDATVGTVEQLRADGKLVGKVGDAPVVVFWSDGQAWAIEDRCPHMGFPLHRGTVQDGLLTCHWHHARFDLASGCTLDLWADDTPAFDVVLDGDDVIVRSRMVVDEVAHLERRLQEGLEESLTLVIAKTVHRLLARGVPPARIVEVGMRFGAANRSTGWGAGMTVAQVALNLLPHVPPDAHGRAITQALSFLARDTRGHSPFFAAAPLTGRTDTDQLGRWYRRFVDTRAPQAAERVLATALRPDRVASDLEAAERFMFAACTDHVFLDEGHTVDFTNKAFEAVGALGPAAATWLLPTVVGSAANAIRHEERSEWREPIDLVPIIDKTAAQLRELVVVGARAGLPDGDVDVAQLGRALLADDPHAVAVALVDAASSGATAEELARAVSFAAALRLVHFHVQNDVGDWDSVHHSFTTANAVHQAVSRRATPELLAGVVHGAMRVYLDRFLNVPAARVPAVTGATPDLAELSRCWDVQGAVDDAGAVVVGYLAGGGTSHDVIAALCDALYREDAGFHWHQVIDAAVRQHDAWPPESEARVLILLGATRWLVAHTPTLRQTEQVVSIATRLLRGDAIYEDLAAG